MTRDTDGIEHIARPGYVEGARQYLRLAAEVDGIACGEAGRRARLYDMPKFVRGVWARGYLIGRGRNVPDPPEWRNLRRLIAIRKAARRYG